MKNSKKLTKRKTKQTAEEIKSIDNRLYQVKQFVEFLSELLDLPVNQFIFRFKKNNEKTFVENAKDSEDLSNKLINEGFRRRKIDLKVEQKKPRKYKIIYTTFEFSCNEEMREEVKEFISRYKPVLFKLKNNEIFEMWLLIEDTGSCNFSNISDAFEINEYNCVSAVCRRSFIVNFDTLYKQPKFILKMFKKTKFFIHKEHDFLSAFCEEMTEMPDELPSQSQKTLDFDKKFIPKILYEASAYIAHYASCKTEIVVPMLLAVLRACIDPNIKVLQSEDSFRNLFTGIFGLIVSQPHSNADKAIDILYMLLAPLIEEAMKHFEEEFVKINTINQIKDLDHKRDKSNLAVAHLDRKLAALDTRFEEAVDDFKKTLYLPEKISEKRLVIKNGDNKTIQECLLKNSKGLCILNKDSIGFLSCLLAGKDIKFNNSVSVAHATDADFILTDDIGKNRTTNIGNLSSIGVCKPRPLAKVIQNSLDNESSSIDMLKMFQFNIFCNEKDDENAIWDVPNMNDLKQSISDFVALTVELHRLEADEEYKLFFTPSTERKFLKYLNDSIDRSQDLMLPEIIRHFYSGLETIVPTLAAIFTFVEKGSIKSFKEKTLKEISEENLEKAVQYCSYLESHTLRILDVDVNIAVECAKIILRNRKKLGEKFSVRDVAQKGWAIIGRNSKLAELGILLLEKYGYFYEDKNDNSKTQYWRRNKYIEQSKLLDI